MLLEKSEEYVNSFTSDEKITGSAFINGNASQMKTTSLLRTTTDSERENNTAQTSPSPLRVPSSFARQTRKPCAGSSSRLVPLMPPPPSPSGVSGSAMKAAHVGELQRENDDLRSELAAVSASLQEALRTVELRELECVELHRLVDRMRGELKRLGREDSSGGAASVTKEAGEAAHFAACVESRYTPAGAEGATEDHPLAPLDARTPAAKVSQIFSASTSPCSLNACSEPSLTYVSCAPQCVCAECDRLAAELAEAKATVAEQKSVLDRLGLHSPYPRKMVAAACRLIRTFEPLSR